MIGQHAGNAGPEPWQAASQTLQRGGQPQTPEWTASGCAALLERAFTTPMSQKKGLNEICLSGDW